MTALVAALLLAGLPEGSARYRVELGGAPVGVAELAVRCGGDRCVAEWRAELRLPEAAGGGIRVRRVRVEVDREGRLAGGSSVEEDGALRPGAAVVSAVPATVAELVLAARARAGPGCVEVFDEASGAVGRACARREGAAVAIDVLGVAARLVPAPDGFPAELTIAAQGARYLRDGRASVPARPPPLDVRVAGPADPAAARTFCGTPVDAPSPAAPAGIPAPVAPGETCREKAAAWVAAAAARGLDARTAVGVAHDGRGFVWHTWAEVRAGGAWVPVDPSFGEAPARGPRFTLARFRAGDGEARDAAGRRILACWGRARVE